MTKEHKLALILGFALVLVVGVLISDHFSRARRAGLDDGGGGESSLPLVDDARQDQVAGWLDLPMRQEREPAHDEITMGRTPPARDLPGPAYPTDTRATSNAGLPSASDPLNEHVLPIGPPSSPKPRIVIPAVPKPAPAPKPITHVVQKDENLWSIAETYYGNGARWPEIARHNASVVGEEGSVREGRKLTIPPMDGMVPVAPEPKPKRSRTQDSPGTYTVQDGDDLGKIAMALFGSAGAWPKIYEANKAKLPDPDTVQVGMVLRIPPR